LAVGSCAKILAESILELLKKEWNQAELEDSL
jgi:hypothetical protein